MKTQTSRLLLRSVLLAGLGWMLAGGAAAQNISTPFSNLNQSSDGYPAAWGPFLDAAAFTTGNTPNFLVGVSVQLNYQSPFPPDGPFILSLYSDAGGSPGTNLATLSGESYPINPGVFTYTNSSPVPLSANSTYWIVDSSPGSQSFNGYPWVASHSSILDAGSTWTMSPSKYYNSGWVLIPGGYLKMSVTVGSANPPPLSIYQPVVLTFTVYPYQPALELQQSPVLPGTNWVTATSAIQMATVKPGQVVYIVPPSGQQMFFRLKVP